MTWRVAPNSIAMLAEMLVFSNTPYAIEICERSGRVVDRFCAMGRSERPYSRFYIGADERQLQMTTEAELATRLEAGPVIRFSTSVMATRATQEAAQ
ncbi:hypothetical protein [Meiothermus ruber]|uniref:hypothetical protein n=1 Tax=Meiothermus ruber TaxID=277 RepID=UPI000AE4BAE6|nr:hypothetical protein [Meiothermus ruber]